MKLIFFILILVTLTQPLFADNERFTINTQSREEVRNFFNTVYQASKNVPMGWTGNTAQCISGTTSPEYRDTVKLRVNFFRAMAGVPNIIFQEEFNRKAQQAALIMSANDKLHHKPPSSWICYTEEGAEAAGKSNLSYGRAGAQAILGQMQDKGTNNRGVGHRRWILYPQIQVMGTGNVAASGKLPATGILWVMTAKWNAPRPTTRNKFVSWPPPGFVPYQAVFPRWSFSYPNADFSQTLVSMQQQGMTIPLSLEPVQNGFGENTLVWVPGLSQTMPPITDIPYTVTVSNVFINETPHIFRYIVTIINPSVLGTDSIFPTISGSTQPVVNNENVYHFNAVPNATGYQLLQAKRNAFTQIEGAENGFNLITANISSGYNVITTDIKASGSASFHLAHSQYTDQMLTFQPTFLANNNSQLTFSSRLGLASTEQIAKVQVSLDKGQTWQDVFSQAGTENGATSALGENNFSIKTVSLNQFASKAIQIRFIYTINGSYFYPQTDAGMGWYIDDISLNSLEELTEQNITDIPSGASFSFKPPRIGDYILQVRAVLYQKYPLEWGPPLLVTACVTPPIDTRAWSKDMKIVRVKPSRFWKP